MPFARAARLTLIGAVLVVSPSAHAEEPPEHCDGFAADRDNAELSWGRRADAAADYVDCLEATLSDSGRFFALTNRQAAELMHARTKSASLGDTADFRGGNFGVGLGFALASGDRVADAELVDGTIRATDEEKQRALVVLEYHNYVACGKKKPNPDFACGPFGGLVSDADEVVSGVAVGWMFGWKKGRTGQSSGYSIGFGALLENDVTDLADGLRVNRPLPAGETEIRFTEDNRWSAVVFTTRTF